MPNNFIMNLLGKATLVFALVTTVILGVAFENEQRDFARLELDLRTQDKTTEASQCHYLLRRLGDGQTEGLRETLSVNLANDLLDIRSLAPAANQPTREFTENFTSRILREEKAHPEYYFTSTPEMRAVQTKLWATLDQPPAPALAKNN